MQTRIANQQHVLHLALHGRLLWIGRKREIGHNDRIRELELVHGEDGGWVGAREGQDSHRGRERARNRLLHHAAALQRGHAPRGQRHQLQPGQRHRPRYQRVEEVGQLVAGQGEELEAQLLRPREHEGVGGFHRQGELLH
jgi:hypothetical protein